MILLDTHVLLWWTTEPDRLSDAAVRSIESADGIGVASITWFELAWLARHHRVLVTIPVRSWLEGLASSVDTIELTASIADLATSLPPTFPGDPADRIIYATALEHGIPLISKDDRMRMNETPVPFVVW